jgi:hypothetical protein
MSYAMKIAPTDSWGNVRVPRLDRLPSANQGDGSTWHPVPAISEVEQLSSLVGVPVIGLPARQAQLVADFTLETSYMALECAGWETFRESESRAEKYKRLWRGQDPLRTGYLLHWAPETERNTTFFVDGDVLGAARANVSGVENDWHPRRLFFASARRGNNTTEFTMSATQCVVTESHVEVAISCPAGSRDCKATRMRRSLVDKRPEFNSSMGFPAALELMALVLPFIMANDGSMSTSTECFLRESTHFMPSQAVQYVNMSEVPPPLFASRLTLVLNTLYQIFLTSGPVHRGNVPIDVPAYGFDFGQLPANGSVPQAVVDESCKHMCTRSTEAVLTHRKQIYSYHPVWLPLLFASSGVLIVAGLAGIILSWRTCAPDVLGYAASMTYNNVYLPLPERGGVLDAMGRARILRDLPVSISDVDGDSEAAGRVAFTSLTDVRPLEKGRKYA